jgi:dCTP diphosphatase
MNVRWGHIPEEARRIRFQKTTRPVGEPWKTCGVSEIEDLQARFREFSKERNWEQFHDPRSLILALVGEVGELSELFQWQTAVIEDANKVESSLHQRAAEEISDVFLYLLRLADVLNVDLLGAAQAKLSAAMVKFPPSEFIGRAPDKIRGT